MARRMNRVDRFDLYGLREQRPLRDWDLWSVVGYVALLVVAIYLLVMGVRSVADRWAVFPKHGEHERST